MINVKNLHKEPLLNLLLISILFFFALNRFISHQPDTCERYAAWIMQPLLSTQQSWINYWKAKEQERMTVAAALAELDKVQQELAWTQSALAEMAAERQQINLTQHITTSIADSVDVERMENSARPDVSTGLNMRSFEINETSRKFTPEAPRRIEGYERVQDLRTSRTRGRHHERKKRSENIKITVAPHPESNPKIERESDILAPILLKSLSDEGHFLLIEGGADQGLEPDMVCVYQNNLIGRITEVYDHISKVLLVTDRSCKVSAVCSEHQVHGIYEGGNSPEQAKLRHVSHLFDVQTDDVVITTGEGLLFPRGYMLGRITHAERAGVNYEISVKPFVDIRAITAVAILPSQISGMPKASCCNPH